MSYDLEVWSVEAIDLRRVLTGDSWREMQDVLTTSGRGWQIVVGPQHRVDFEDVPDEVHAALAGVAHMTELQLEPISAPKSSRAILLRTSKALAAAAHGAVVDPQTSELITPAGVRR